jgi:hypothetical protein
MLKLEVFETLGANDTVAYLDPHSAAKLRESAFEQGYGAGWQDALDQMRGEDALRRAATFEAVQALTFTFAEARAMCEGQLADIVTDLVTKILPEMCAVSLSGRVSQELRLLLARDRTAPLQILCAPDSIALLAPVLTDLPDGACVTLVPEPSYSAAQVSLQGQGQRRHVDLSSVADSLRAALVTPSRPIATPAASLPYRGAQHG